jgi:2,5-diketo-D-gluconate reductase A
VSDGFFRPAVCGRDNHADAWYGHQHLQQGRSAIPKSTRPARIAENFDVFDFRLSDFELARIDALDKGVRPGPEPADITPETFGRKIPEA